MAFRPIGSLWGRWDLHFHTQSSYDYAYKALTNAEIIQGLKAAEIKAAAVTDHHIIDAKRIRNLQSIAGADLTLFPGIELRSELGGKESVHLIGIFPEDADAEHIWTKLQGPLRITPTETAQIGDDRVYVHFEKAADLIHELGGIVSVHVGRKSNSLENIGNDHPYKQAFKDDLARKHIDLFELGQTKDGLAYREKIFPNIGYERPLIICSDNHDIRNYQLKASLWIKGDLAFPTFQQIKSDPQERVYIGEMPPQVERVAKNPTKYLKSISFSKQQSSQLKEYWFSGSVPLNQGLIAIIGNKGAGKTALAESIGLLGNTAQSGEFSFLNPHKFRQLRDNKAKHFSAAIEWTDGQQISKSLDGAVASDAIELVGYIPQHYIETICNEIQSSDSRFEKELKSVIYSHVEEANRLGAQTLDELLQGLTEQTFARMKQLRAELSKTNKKVVELQKQSSPESKQLLLNLYDRKKHELEVHKKSKPTQVTKPETDPEKQKEMQEIAEQIEVRQAQQGQIVAELKRLERVNREALLKKSISERIRARIDNFKAQYETFIAEADSDCSQLSLDPRKLVVMQTDVAPVDEIRQNAQAQIAEAAEAKEKQRIKSAELKKAVISMTAQLDAPSNRYQRYLQELQEWEQQRDEIIGGGQESGSIQFIERQLNEFHDLPARLKEAKKEQGKKTRQIYQQIEQLNATYKSLYSPVQEFIEQHDLKSKFNFQFEASIVCQDLDKSLLTKVNQARRGSFSGAEEGKKVLNNLTVTADFGSEDGALAFTATLVDYLTHDRRDSAGSPVAIADQLRKDFAEESILDDIFALQYLQPRYTIKWFGKDIEQLSPGERGALLLVFYLLIDRRDIPLIIDQPEENLDNQTVFDLLVPCIKKARQRRQVVIVTHNPNLAVVCDADQVIHCNIDKSAKNKVTYTAGSLENPINNRLTVDVLEGTMPAFDHRDAKYQS